MRTPLSAPRFDTWTYSDGYVARGRVWDPPTDRPVRGVVLYLHGIQSHSGWYPWSASLLHACGYAVVVPDRRGSGLNADQRGDVPEARRWFADLDEHFGWIQAAWGVERITLFGVSWGGKLAAAWLQRHPQRVDRVLMIAPGVFPLVDITWWEKMGVGVSLFREPTRLFPIPLMEESLFTDNPAGQAFIRDDSLKLTHVTARFLVQSRKLDRPLHRAKPGSIPVPATIFFAGQEKIIRAEKTAEWASQVFVPPPDIRWFTPDRHTLEFAEDVSRYEQALRSWAELQPITEPRVEHRGNASAEEST